MNGLDMPTQTDWMLRSKLTYSSGRVATSSTVAGLGEDPVDPLVLAMIDSYGAAEHLEPERALVPGAGERAQQVVEAAQLAQRGQRAAVGRVLPGA